MNVHFSLRPFLNINMSIDTKLIYTWVYNGEVRWERSPKSPAMTDATLTESGREALREQYTAYKPAYKRINQRIHGVRGAYVASDEETRITALRRAYAYGLLTANTVLEAADVSYGRWLQGDGPKEVCYEGQHTDKKGDWFASGLENFAEKARPIDDRILAGEYAEAAEEAADNLTGISRVKARFMIGLLTGKTGCIDTHAESFIKENVIGGESLVANKNNADPSDYEAAMETIDSGVPEVCRFVAQWLAFDHERETFTPHDNFYNSLPFAL